MSIRCIVSVALALIAVAASHPAGLRAQTFGVAVSPAEITVTVPGDSRQTQRFWVKNTGTAGMRNYVIMGPACNWPVRDCVWSTFGLWIAQGDSGAVDVTFTAGPNGTTGNAHFDAKVNDDQSVSARGVVYVQASSTPPPDGITVTPSSGTEEVPPYAQARQKTFMVRNTSGRTVDVSIQGADCQPFEMFCSFSTQSISGLAPNAEAPVTVTFTSGPPGWSGTIALTAKINDNQSVAASAAVSVTVPVQAWLETKSLNPGTSITRSACVTFPVATNSAYECGDLVIAHAMPSLRVRGDDRTPVLLYTSAHATPAPVVLANLSAPAGGATNVSASLTIRRGGSDVQVVAPTSFADIPGGETRRIAVAYDAQTDTTGVYPYTLTVTMNVGGVPATLTASDTLVVVNRQLSVFGGGWWVAGYEQLVRLPGGDFLWVGGDGSTRRYVRDTLRAGEAYGAAGFVRPDSLVLDGSVYVRQLRHRARVEFDASGRHVATKEPHGVATTFQHDASGRLERIIHPTASAPTHRFFYGGATGQLDSVTGPGPAGGTRRVRIERFGRRIGRIYDADERDVSFAYLTDSDFIIRHRANRNAIATNFALASSRLIEARVPLTNAGQSAISSFCPAEIRGLASGGCAAGSLPVADAVTTIDGPRPDTDVNDVTRIKTDRFGAPAVVTDPLGNSLRLFRGNRGFPGLVTRVIHKNGWVNEAFYDAKGLIATRVEYGPLGPGRDAVTSYTWDPKWERVTGITYPEGNTVSFAYEFETGNRLWQQVGSDASRRVSFAYNATGPAQHLMSSATYPVVQAGRTDKDSVEYDALGNPAVVRVLGNAETLSVERYSNDAAGRTTSVCSDIAVNGAKQCTNAAFDVMDRDSVATSLGDAVNGTAAQSVVVTTTFDREGNPRVIVRDPSDGPLQPQVTRRGYDIANRLVADTASDGLVELRSYDPAGNLTTLITRRGDTLTMAYDAMNRLSSRTLSGRLFPKDTVGLATISPNSPAINPPYPRKPNDPNGFRILAETHQFAYDERGLLTSARNPNAWVGRTYFANGLIASETDSVRTVAGGDLSQHVYRIGYDYDLNGRLRALRYPAQLVRSPNNARDSVVYTYDSQTGQVAQVSDLLGNVFAYAYDNSGQLAHFDMPGGLRESFTYDAAGRVTGDTIRTAQNAFLRATEFTYGDARGKVTRSRNTVLKRDSLTATYSGLGFVVSSTYRDIGTDWRGFTQNFSSAETFTYDGLGNILGSTTATVNSSAADEHTHNSTGRTYIYHPVSGRLARMDGDPRPDSLVYDENGNVRFQYTRTPPFTVPIREDRMSYFAADGTLRAADHRTRVRDNQSFTFTFEEYWYDPLGRRVLTRTRRDCSPTDYDLETCSISTARRTVWDGVKELFEIQMPDTTAVVLVENDTTSLPNLGTTLTAEPMARNPFYGRVGYTNGPGLDQPLSVTRWGYADTAFVGTATQQRFEQWKEPFAIVPHWNMRGQADHGTTASGGGANCGGGTPPSGGASSGRCALVYWPYGWTAYWQKTYRQPSWNGTLLDQKRDGSQLIYKRNRYYDPATSRFTQEDPIGLAGGLNLYGFASGDPVNFSDPFGLCPPADDNPYDCPGRMGAFVMLGQMAPQINREVAMFLPGNLASAAGGMVLGKAVSLVAGALRGGAVAAGAEAAEEVGASARTPVGSRRSPMHVPRGTNAPTEIAGRRYTGHAIDQMQGRGITPSMVEETITQGAQSAGHSGASVYQLPGIKIVVNPSGSVKTVIWQ